MENLDNKDKIEVNFGKDECILFENYDIMIRKSLDENDKIGNAAIFVTTK